MKSTKRVTEGFSPMIAPQPSSSGGSSSTSGAPVPANLQALERAKLLARQINLERNIGVGAKDATQQTAEAVLKGAVATPINMSAKTIAQQLAGRLNERLNYVPAEQPVVEEQPQYTRYEEELEINDFPQQVRWRVTSRETLNLVQDYTEVGVSVKGTHVPPGKEPKDGDRKLYLALEATSEIGIARAKAEIMRVLKEELRRLASQAAGQNVNKARYKVV